MAEDSDGGVRPRVHPGRPHASLRWHAAVVLMRQPLRRTRVPQEPIAAASGHRAQAAQACGAVAHKLRATGTPGHPGWRGLPERTRPKPVELRKQREKPAPLLAERGGFEPPVPQGHTRFRVVPFQPGSRTSPEAPLLAQGARPGHPISARDARFSARGRTAARARGTPPLRRRVRR